MTATILTIARLILPTEMIPGALVLHGGRSAGIDPGLRAAAAAIGCAGDPLVQGCAPMRSGRAGLGAARRWCVESGCRGRGWTAAPLDGARVPWQRARP